MNNRRKNDSGQVLLLGVIMLVIMLFALFFFFDIHNVIRGKLKLEIAEQSSALTAAKWQAKSLNLIGELNLLIAVESVMENSAIAVPERFEDSENDSEETKLQKKYKRGNARIKSINEMQSRITFIGPLIALAAAQQTAKNNGINPVKASNDYNKNRPANIADEFESYLERLKDDKIYSSEQNIRIHGYKWQAPYSEMIEAIKNDGVSVRPSGLTSGIEGINPSYLADGEFYNAVIACEKGYPAWCHRYLRWLVKQDDSYFEGQSWYLPDFSWIRFAQQSEIYPLDLRLPDILREGLYESFEKAANEFKYRLMNEDTAKLYNSRFYEYNTRWFPSEHNYNGPVTVGDSPWQGGVFLREDVSPDAIYGGAMAYAECVENMPVLIPIKSAYSRSKAKSFFNLQSKLDNDNDEPKNSKFLVARNTNFFSDSNGEEANENTQVGGNFSKDRQNSGVVAKPLGKLANNNPPTALPIVLPVFSKASIIPSTMQNIRIFSFYLPLEEEFIIKLSELIGQGLKIENGIVSFNGQLIYDGNYVRDNEIIRNSMNREDWKKIYDTLELPNNSEHMIEALRLLSKKEFRRKGYNPEYKEKEEIATTAVLKKYFERKNDVYHPETNPLGPGWLQKPVVCNGRYVYLPEDAYRENFFYYTAAIAKELKKKAADELRQKLISSGQSFTEDDINALLPNYTEPPEDEVWVCCNGEYIRVRNGKLEYIMEDDPYIGCGVMPGNCTCNNCISPGTNYGPSRL